MEREYTSIIPDSWETEADGMVSLTLKNEKKTVTVILFPRDVAAVITVLAEGLADRLDQERDR